MATVTNQMVEAAKLAARITTHVYDSQIQDLLETALLDLGVAGVVIPEDMGGLVMQAAITFFLMRFGDPDNYERLKASYDEQKAQLATCTGYTTWTDQT
jgi:hypothetical protein